MITLESYPSTVLCSRAGDIGIVKCAFENGQGNLARRNSKGSGLIQRPSFSYDNWQGREDYGGQNAEIYMMKADGSSLVNITNHGHSDDAPAWSPDGTKIAFESHRENNIPEIWAMNDDISNPVKVSNQPKGDIQPDW